MPTQAERQSLLDVLGFALNLANDMEPVGSVPAPPPPVPAPPPPAPNPPPPPPPAPNPPPPPPPPPPAPPPAGNRPALYFSAMGSNSNSGTITAPKRDLGGINVNSIPPTDLFFRGGDTFTFTGSLRLQNPNVSAANPLRFNTYGTGKATFLATGTGHFVEWGEWGGTTLYDGYEFRNIVFDGNGAGRHGIWLRGAVDAIVVEDCEVTRFQFGVVGQGGQNVRGLTMRRTYIHHNSDMGVQGCLPHSLIEDCDINENNFTGSGFSHGLYCSNLTNLTIRNNRFRRNSVVNGVCTGGNLTLHGQVNGLVIEGNTIEQDACTSYMMSITQGGYATAEWFRNTVIRNNTLINPGPNGINVQSAPGVVVEDNRIINRQGTNCTAISVGHTDYPNGDLVDNGAIVRRNRYYQVNGSSGPCAYVYPTANAAVNEDNITVQGEPA